MDLKKAQIVREKVEQLDELDEIISNINDGSLIAIHISTPSVGGVMSERVMPIDNQHGARDSLIRTLLNKREAVKTWLQNL